MAALMILLAGLIGWYSKTDVPKVEPPDVDVSSADAAVVDLLQAARQEVLDQPQHAHAWGKLGMILLAHEWELQAADCFAEATRLDPQDARWPYFEGLCMVSRNRDAAIQLFRRAAAQQSDIGAVYNRMGELLLEAMHLEDARTALETARRQAPHAVRPIIALARVAQLQGKSDEAQQLLTDLIRQVPDLRLAHELLAMVFTSQGDRASAEREMQRAASLPEVDLEWRDPVAAEAMSWRRDVRWRLMGARELLAGGDYRNGIRALQSILSKEKRLPEVFCMLGRALTEAGDPAAALAVLKDGANRHPGAADVWFHQGNALFLQGQLPESRASLEEAVRLKPDFPLALFNLGHILEQTGETQQALDMYQRCLAAQPSFLQAHFAAARLLAAQGKNDAARQHLQEVLVLNPDDAQAQTLMKQLSD